MHSQARYFLLFISAFALSAIYLIQISCEKDQEVLSEAQFVSNLKGEWLVYQYSSGSDIQIILLDDVLRYSSSKDWITYNYPVDNPIICTIPGMENMGNWTIALENNSLVLETRDFCDAIKNYKIQYSNYGYVSYQTYFGIETDMNLINAFINLIDSESIISPYLLKIDKHAHPTEMQLTMTNNSWPGGFILHSK